MPKRPATNTENKNVTDLDTNVDPLADLGLDATDAPDTAPETDAPDDASADAGDNDMARRSRNDDDFGEITIQTVKEVPSARRAGGGSKFPFTQLPAPTKDQIGTFFVPFKGSSEEEAQKFKRSVQSATTQANRTNAEAGMYFESRSVVEGGKFKGISVYRTDDRPADE